MAEEVKGFTLNYKNMFDIDTSGGEVTPTWAKIASGITSVEPSFEDQTDDTAYYDGEGFNNLDVVGVNASLTFTGHRKYGDEAQDYVAGLEFELGEGRKTKLRWTQPDGRTITGDVTISGIKSSGGDANAKSEFEFTATFNGRPDVSPTP